MEKILSILLEKAKQGDSRAQNSLGSKHAAEQDYEEGVRWFRKAAEQGFATAQFNLGFMYELGLGVQQDCEKAASWYRKAAEQGDVAAQFSLGVMYLQGRRGVKQDYEKSYKWFKIANALGDIGAKMESDLAKGELNHQQIEETEDEVSQWLEKFSQKK